MFSKKEISFKNIIKYQDLQISSCIMLKLDSLELTYKFIHEWNDKILRISLELKIQTIIVTHWYDCEVGWLYNSCKNPFLY